jgi:hypothetical protein
MANQSGDALTEPASPVPSQEAAREEYGTPPWAEEDLGAVEGLSDLPSPALDALGVLAEEATRSDDGTQVDAPSISVLENAGGSTEPELGFTPAVRDLIDRQLRTSGINLGQKTLDLVNLYRDTNGNTTLAVQGVYEKYGVGNSKPEIIGVLTHQLERDDLDPILKGHIRKIITELNTSEDVEVAATDLSEVAGTQGDASELPVLADGVATIGAETATKPIDDRIVEKALSGYEKKLLALANEGKSDQEIAQYIRDIEASLSAIKGSGMSRQEKGAELQLEAIKRFKANNPELFPVESTATGDLSNAGEAAVPADVGALDFGPPIFVPTAAEADLPVAAVVSGETGRNVEGAGKPKPSAREKLKYLTTSNPVARIVYEVKYGDRTREELGSELNKLKEKLKTAHPSGAQNIQNQINTIEAAITDLGIQIDVPAESESIVDESAGEATLTSEEWDEYKREQFRTYDALLTTGASGAKREVIDVINSLLVDNSPLNEAQKAELREKYKDLLAEAESTVLDPEWVQNIDAILSGTITNIPAEHALQMIRLVEAHSETPNKQKEELRRRYPQAFEELPVPAEDVPDRADTSVDTAAATMTPELWESKKQEAFSTYNDLQKSSDAAVRAGVRNEIKRLIAETSPLSDEQKAELSEKYKDLLAEADPVENPTLTPADLKAKIDKLAVDFNTYQKVEGNERKTFIDYLNEKNIDHNAPEVIGIIINILADKRFLAEADHNVLWGGDMLSEDRFKALIGSSPFAVNENAIDSLYEAYKAKFNAMKNPEPSPEPKPEDGEKRTGIEDYIAKMEAELAVREFNRIATTWRREKFIESIKKIGKWGALLLAAFALVYGISTNQPAIWGPGAALLGMATLTVISTGARNWWTGGDPAKEAKIKRDITNAKLLNQGYKTIEEKYMKELTPKQQRSITNVINGFNGKPGERFENIIQGAPENVQLFGNSSPRNAAA